MDVNNRADLISAIADNIHTGKRPGVAGDVVGNILSLILGLSAPWSDDNEIPVPAATSYEISDWQTDRAALWGNRPKFTVLLQDPDEEENSLKFRHITTIQPDYTYDEDGKLLSVYFNLGPFEKNYKILIHS